MRNEQIIKKNNKNSRDDRSFVSCALRGKGKSSKINGLFVWEFRRWGTQPIVITILYENLTSAGFSTVFSTAIDTSLSPLDSS